MAGERVAVAAMLWAISLTEDLPTLRDWWREHSPAMRRLTPEGFAAVEAAKDARKAALLLGAEGQG